MKQRTPIKRTAPPKRSTKRIPRVNMERKAKRSKRYRSFLASAKWRELRKAALERAGNRCEQQGLGLIHRGAEGWTARCPSTTRLHVDHETYARFGGNELPDDLTVRCHDCHMRRHALQGKRIA